MKTSSLLIGVSSVVFGFVAFTGSAVIEAVPGADAGILRIKTGGTYAWTDGGQVTRGRLRLFEPGVCQVGEGMAHYVVRGSVLGRTDYIVRNSSGITLENVKTGLYDFGGKPLR